MEPLPVHNGPDGAKPKGWSYRNNAQKAVLIRHCRSN